MSFPFLINMKTLALAGVREARIIFIDTLSWANRKQSTVMVITVCMPLFVFRPKLLMVDEGEWMSPTACFVSRRHAEVSRSKVHSSLRCYSSGCFICFLLVRLFVFLSCSFLWRRATREVEACQSSLIFDCIILNGVYILAQGKAKQQCLGRHSCL